MGILLEKRTQTGTLLWLLLILSLFISPLDQIPVIGSGAKLLPDLIWALLLVYLLRFGREVLKGPLGLFTLWTGCFFLVTLLAALIQGQRPWFYLWGLRNNFRFYVGFLAAGAFLRKKDGEELFRLLSWLFWLNVPVTLIQFFLFGIRGDYLGGIFGTSAGVNGDTNLFFTVVITHSILEALEGRERMPVCLGKSTAALAIAAMAELKFFFVLFLVILVLAVLGRDITWRKLTLILGCCGAAGAGAAVLTKLFPRFRGWFSLSWFWRTAVSAMGYTSSGDLNRLTAISAINARFFREWHQRLLGFGLGDCDTSSFSFLHTPFFRDYGWLHYNWMSHSFWYLELGFVGLGFFFGFFLLVFCMARGRPYGRQSRILSLCCLLIGVYNASLRTEMANLVYLVLALPFLGGEEP